MFRKSCLYLALALCFGCLAWMKLGNARWLPQRFTPPGASARKAAVGSTHGVSPKLKAAFDAGAESFSPIPKPGRSDWLANISETGQTFAQYQRSDPNRPDENRTTIYLQPLGGFPPEVAPDLDSLAAYASVFFDMPVKQLETVPVDGLPVKSRRRSHGRQMLANDVLTWLKPRVPKDGYCLLAVTMTDLYPSADWNFVFGQGSLKDRVGVYSFARYVSDGGGSTPNSSDERLLLLRSCKVLAHETGHIFGIKHCVHFHCLMNGSNGLAETDAAPIHLCPVCLRKLHSAKSLDVEQRYRKLRTLSNQFGWDEETQWLGDRIRSLDAIGE